MLFIFVDFFASFINTKTNLLILCMGETLRLGTEEDGSTPTAAWQLQAREVGRSHRGAS